jgi:hypothetical protein
MNRITDRSLIELVARATRGVWAVSSDENFKFNIYSRDSSPIKYIIEEIPDSVSNYDIRLMALARELAEEVIELRRKQRSLIDDALQENPRQQQVQESVGADIQQEASSSVLRWGR